MMSGQQRETERDRERQRLDEERRTEYGIMYAMMHAIMYAIMHATKRLDDERPKGGVFARARPLALQVVGGLFDAVEHLLSYAEQVLDVLLRQCRTLPRQLVLRHALLCHLILWHIASAGISARARLGPRHSSP